jgi:hypothetical protein
MALRPPAGALIEVAMSRILSAAMLLVMLGAAGDAFAQAGCQPTITQPCAKTSDKPSPQLPKRTNAARPDEPNEPIDHSPRIKIDKDTDFKFGSGGIGLGRKF